MTPRDSIAHSAALFELTNALQPIRRAWLQAASFALADFGLPSSLASTVILASRHGRNGVRQNALAEEVGVNPGAMVRILDQGERAGLLERRDSAEDRRIKTVHLLPKGRDMVHQMEKAIAGLRHRLLSDLPVDEVETTTRLLRRFETRIGAFLQQERADR